MVEQGRNPVTRCTAPCCFHVVQCALRLDKTLMLFWCRRVFRARTSLQKGPSIIPVTRLQHRAFFMLGSVLYESTNFNVLLVQTCV